MVRKWFANGYAMTSGCAFKTCCLAKPVIRAVRDMTTGCSSRLCCGLPARAAHGEIFRKSLVPGTRYTNASPGGPSRACGSVCSSSSPPKLISRKFLSTPPSFARTSTQLARQKKRRSSARALARWTEHEDTCAGRWAGPTCTLLSQPGASPRQHPCRGAARRVESASGHRRQGLRQQRLAADHRCHGREGRHPASCQSLGATILGRTPIQASQSHRKILLPSEAVSPRRDTPRQVDATLRVIRPPHGSNLLARVNVNTP